jgi:hypothetical protein
LLVEFDSDVLCRPWFEILRDADHTPERVTIQQCAVVHRHESAVVHSNGIDSDSRAVRGLLAERHRRGRLWPFDSLDGAVHQRVDRADVVVEFCREALGEREREGVAVVGPVDGRVLLEPTASVLCQQRVVVRITECERVEAPALVLEGVPGANL